MRDIWKSLVIVGLLASFAHAWHDEGHAYIARAAVEALPGDFPAFFRDDVGRDAIAHGALDPDVIRNPKLPQLREALSPEHFIDLEVFDGHVLPQTRPQFVALCAQLEVDPYKMGMLPYAITERAQWLTMAFAEHRRWPDNPHVKRKCLVLAGVLAHYTADLHMPLHTTVHYDGRMRRDGSGAWVAAGPKTAIHARFDALPTKLPYAVLFDSPIDTPAPHGDVLSYVFDELAKSHALVGRVYELEPRVPPLAELSLEDEQVRRFTIERVRAAAAFTAGVYLSAWRNSAELEPPHWLDRTIFDERFDPARVPPQP